VAINNGNGITKDELQTMVKDYYMERGWCDKGVLPE